MPACSHFFFLIQNFPVILLFIPMDIDFGPLQSHVIVNVEQDRYMMFRSCPELAAWIQSMLQVRPEAPTPKMLTGR
jgi:hypothetical protein